jgi:HSP20 family protein
MKESTMALPVRRNPQTTGLDRRSTPFGELDDLHSRMEQLMSGIWSELPDVAAPIWAPPVDIEETEDAWIVEANLPGVDKKDVNIEVRESEVVVNGEIKERERKGILRRRTRPVGRFEYRVALPGQTDPENVEATLDDGVLRIQIPKPEQTRPRRIEVTSNGASNGSSGS